MIRRVAIAFLFAVLCVRLWNDAYHFARCSFTLDTIAECTQKTVAITGKWSGAISAEVVASDEQIGSSVWVSAATGMTTVSVNCISDCKFDQ